MPVPPSAGTPLVDPVVRPRAPSDGHCLYRISNSLQTGSKTPGMDNVLWKTSGQKMRAVLSLKRKGYQTKPLKRIYIPKKQKGKLPPGSGCV